MWHDSFICVMWLIPTCDMTHPCLCHDLFMCVTLPIHVCDATLIAYLHQQFTAYCGNAEYVWHGSFICMPCILHICDMTRLHLNDSCHICEWVMSNVWMSHATRVNESPVRVVLPKKCEWVMLEYICVMVHTQMSHGTHTNDSWHTHKWAMAHTQMSHGTHTNEPWHTHKWVMAHTQMSHGTRTEESWCVMATIWMGHGTHEWVMAHIWMRLSTRMNEAWHPYK